MMPTSEDDIRAHLVRHVPRRQLGDRPTMLGAGGYDIDAGRRYLQAVRPIGLGVPTWPAEYGGRSAGAAEVVRIEQVCEEFALPDLYPFRIGMRMVGPTLLEHGTEDQRRRWLANIASGAEIWCQMFSEPGAGSDLANVATRATQTDAGWVLSGQKVWTSRADYADFGICLARTYPQAPKHRGLTMFAVPMPASGVDVRPLRQMNGDEHFSEVFLTDVSVPDTNRIGAVNAGWPVAVTLLAYERAGSDRRSALAADGTGLPAWLIELSSNGALTDHVLRDRAMDLFCLERAIDMTRVRAAEQQLNGSPGAQGSVLKLLGAESFKRRAELMLDALGPAGMLADSAAALDYLTAPSMSIRGGTDEIQRNVIGERVLGLPVEPRQDREVPWSASRRGDL